MGEIAKREQGAVVPMNAEAMIMKALENNVPVEVMERLLAMRSTIKAEQAREAYYAALGAFQSECPSIEKTRHVKDRSGAVRYSYASLDDIVRQVSPLLAKHGLSYTIKTEHRDGFIIATCEVHHAMGHSESSTFPVPIEKEGFMNDAQKAGSAMTYAKRYAFSNAFGIMTTDHDDDGQSTGETLSAKDIYSKAKHHMDAVREYWDSITAIRDGIATGNLDQAAEALVEIPDEAKQALWVAPTKGGIFTTEERAIMKSDEFQEIKRKYIEPGVNA